MIYPKLALTGIRGNKQLYIPYLLTCTGMTAVLYIICFLANSPLVEALPGGGPIQTMMVLGVGVMTVFAAVFLFYTNSFLIRRRKKEFGLYNVLGMGKGNIARILVWETLLTAVGTIAAGLAVGVALSKLVELVLVKIMNADASYTFFVSFRALEQTALTLGLIFLLLLFNTLRQVRLSKPIALLRSENTGEKPPKANWFLGLAGAVILAGAYWLAVSIEEPLTALLWFFVAVGMVVLATYLLFICGSVVLCRLLQKNKRYYYQARHFVSVSSMAFRMKRSGAGLASICILATMVLVMLSSSACLYFGTEESLRTRYPRDVMFSMYFDEVSDLSEENMALFHAQVNQLEDAYQVEPEHVLDYRCCILTGQLQDGVLEWDTDAVSDFQWDTYDQVVNVCFIPLEDHNRVMGTAEILEPGEALVYGYRLDYTEPVLTVWGGDTYRIKGVLEEGIQNGFTAADMIPTLYVVLPDFETAMETVMALGENQKQATMGWFYGFDTALGGAVRAELLPELRNWVGETMRQYVEGSFSYSIGDIESDREEFYGTYGGIFFLGILLSVVFLVATVLILYYKQVSEGYEDRARFAIMRKVGMTREDIRSSINSQMLTVFFLPLATAVVHLAFAFPMIRKLLVLFNLTNLQLLLTTCGISILAFAALYTMMYKITSNVYYRIVSQ